MFGFLFLFLFSSVNGYFLVAEECLNYTVYPIQYDLTIIPYLYKESSYYHCDLTITVIANVNAIRTIELEAKDLEIQGGSIKVMDGNVDIVDRSRPFQYDGVNGKLYIYLREPLKVYTINNAQKYYIKILFNKNVKEDSTGIFLVKYYEDKEQNMKYMYTTRLSPYKAKFMFPCFGNPRFEAVFKFKIYVPPRRPDMQFANTSIVISKEMKTEISRDNYTVIEYIPSPLVSLHQLGFHYSQFTHSQAKAHSTNDTILVWAPGDKLKYYDFILQFGQSIINMIHKYSTINRPILHGPINIVAVPSDVNGYEIGSWALLTNGANKIANVEQLTSIKQIDRMTFELAQQLCRIWLGNPGELKRTRWKEEWFKEGMSTYLAYYFLSQYYYGESTIHHRQSLMTYGLQMKHRAMAVDWHRSTPALESFNTSLAIEIPARHKDLVTMKTGALLWMLENWLESEKFHQALVKYINSRRGEYVYLIHMQDFMTALDADTEECSHQFFNGSTASRILKSWFQQPGYPVINVQVLRDRTPNAVQLKQTIQFTQDNRGETEYLIPIAYLVENKENCYNCYRPRFTIGRQTYTFSENLDGGWIILNRNASGYYRVNYDAVTWRLIAKTLREDMLSIDEMNRAQIVNDVLALFVAGDLDLSMAIHILDYLDSETSPVVWESVASGFELLKIEGASCHMDKHLYWEWEDFMSKKIDNIYRKLVFDGNQHPNVRRFRSNIVTFTATVNHQQCLTYLHQMYADSRRGKQILDPDTREACYYMLSNDTNSHFAFRKLNPIEHEDRIIADHRLREHNRFLIKIPYGVPRPLPLMSTETPSTQAPVTEKMSVGDNSMKHAASLLLIFVSLILTFLR